MASYLWPRSESESTSVAVILPGVRYTAQAPLLYWCAEMLSELGWQVQVVDWTIDEGAAADPLPFVERAVTEAFAAAPHATRRLVVAKSFGTYALPWARREGIPGVWLTPILTSDAVCEGLLAATSADIAVGGEADALWRPESITGTGAKVVSVPGADHSLAVAGDWRRSLAVQNDVLTAIAQHLESRN